LGNKEYMPAVLWKDGISWNGGRKSYWFAL